MDPNELARQHQVARGGDIAARWKLASGTCDPSVDSVLVLDPDSWVRTALASKDPVLSDLVSEALARDEDDMVREALARSTDRSGILHILVRDEAMGVRRRAAENPDLPEACQLVALEDPSPVVREALAWNEGLTVEVQMTLAGREEPVRKALARNHFLDPQTQALLAQDPAEEVLDALERNPGLLMAETLPVPFLKRIYGGQEFIDFKLGGSDPNARAVLPEEWVGTLEELVRTVGSLAAHPGD